VRIRAMTCIVTLSIAVLGLPAAASHAPRHLGNMPSPMGGIRISATPTGSGYFTMDGLGGIFTHGDARFFGSVPGLRQQGHSIGAARVVDLSTTTDGRGYWILDDAGGIFTFGNANFFGSVPGLRNAGLAIGMARVLDLAPTASNGGYYLLDEAGGVFTFGDAIFYGSIPQLRERGVAIGEADVVAITPFPRGGGYWMLDESGGLFSFGRAPFLGSLPGRGIAARAIAMAATPNGDGYWIATADGGVHAFGAAKYFGSAVGKTGGNPVTGFSASPHGTGYWLLVSSGHVIVYPGGAGEITPLVNFGPGTKRVGVDIPAGTFRTRVDSPNCYWERLRGFSGSLDDIISNNFTPYRDVVTIEPTDAGFNSSSCSTWTTDLSPVTPSPTTPFSAGTFIVGTDIAAGKWSAPGGSGCYWERLSGFSGELKHILANDFGATSPVVEIAGSDRGFSSSGCGTWSKVG